MGSCIQSFSLEKRISDAQIFILLGSMSVIIIGNVGPHDGPNADAHAHRLHIYVHDGH